jgi:hypothetical protein
MAAATVNAWAVDSGLKVGEKAGPFVVEDVTGPHKGDSLCYRCEYGDAPVVSVFTRELDGAVWDAVKDLDKKLADNKELKAFVVFLTDDKEAGMKNLKELATKHEIKNVPLTLMAAKGPKGYMLNADAGVTVMMWEKGEVVVNHAFGDHEFCSQCQKMVIGDLAKLGK